MPNGVSTLMPVYLRSAGPPEINALLRSARSVLSQDCGVPLELLIVDDGSSPELRSLPGLKPLLGAPQVGLVRLVQNQGLVYALNAGLRNARYDLIARIDGDDFWRAGKLKQQLEFLETDPDLTLVATSMRLVHPHDPSLDHDDLRGGGWCDALSFFQRVGCPFPHGSILARRDVFEVLGGYPHSPDYAHCEDFALWGSWVRFFKVATLSEVLFEYTISERQVSSRHREQQRRASGLVHQTFLDLGNHARVPWAVERIAVKLGLPLLATSKILCTAWTFYDDILVDADLYEPARVVFPDRQVHFYDEVIDLLGDRFFYLHCGDFDEAHSRHARCVHTPETLYSLLGIVAGPRDPLQAPG